MPGTPLLYVSDSYQGVQGEGVPSSSPAAPAAGLGWGFWLWLLVIGVVIPGVILGSLRAGGFQFVFKRR